MKENRPMRVALLGLGTVGLGVYEYLRDRKDMEVACAMSLTVPEGVTCPIISDINLILQDDTIDTVVEVMGGLHPALDWVSAAIKAGKNVVTANKLLIANHYDYLVGLAKEQGVALRCTAAVGGGIPWLTNLERCVKQEPVIRLGGIMNGTTNYILDAMDKTGRSYEDALKEAQKLGYAEADPTADVSGADVRRKLVISSNVAFGCSLCEDDVSTLGIEGITERDIRAFCRLGRVCKLLAEACPTENGVAAFVEPALVTTSMPESAIPENYNLITLEGRQIGVQSFFGQGAGRYPTAYNVVQDCVDISRGVISFYTDRFTPAKVDNQAVCRCYYVRVKKVDAWLEAHTDQRLTCGILTKPVSVAELHAWAKQTRQADPICFVASLR